MGQYLACGIATQIRIERDWKSDKTEKILEKLGRKINLDIYDVYADDDIICLDIKKNLFEKYAVSFIEEQLEIIKDSLTYEYEVEGLKDLKKIKGKSYDELIKISNDKSCFYFQMLEGNRVCNDVGYLADGETAYADVVTYISDGKIYMECYYQMFDYIRELIIKSSTNPIKTAAVVTIIG